MEFDRELAVKKFQEYLRIKSVHPDPDYDSVVAFLREYAKELQVDIKCLEYGKARRVVVLMTIPGKDPSLPSILLNSHTDVVPVFSEKWICDPWSAEIKENGNIYGRGTQDMKSVGIQYLEAIRVLKLLQKDKFERTVHLCFVPDEEICGNDGMISFCKSAEFKALNVGLALDEGLANPSNKYSIFYAEKNTWWVRVKCMGSPGHGSRFIENTAAEKLQKVIKSFLDFRKSEQGKLESNSCMSLGDVTTVNLTMLEGGVQPNVVPEEFVATFDIRLPLAVDFAKFEENIRHWCSEAGSDVVYEFIFKCLDKSACTDENPWWPTVIGVLKERGVEVVEEVFCAGTDGQLLRELGYPVIGFSPMRNTPVLLHDNNEFLNKNIFLEGIEVYCDIIPAIANLII